MGIELAIFIIGVGLAAAPASSAEFPPPPPVNDTEELEETEQSKAEAKAEPEETESSELESIDEDLEEDLWDPEVITPTGQPTRISETPSATFVITGDEIRRSGAESLPEILRRVPGLEVRQLSASDGQVSARGFVLELSNRILVLVDGRTTAVDFLGSTVWELLEISTIDIDRIEVVLGPGASVYGNKAMNGTINIITRSASDYPRLEAQSSVGPDGYLRGAGRWGVRAGSWRFRATGSLRQLSLFEPSPPEEALDAASGTLNIGFEPSPATSISLEGGVTRGRLHVIAVGPRVEPFRTLLGYVKLDGRKSLGGAGAPYGDLTFRMVYNRGRFESQSFSCSPDTNNECPFVATYETPYFELSHALRYTLGVPMALRWGGELRLMRMKSTITTNERDILNLAAFASNEILLDSWRFSTGLRIDRQNFTKFTLSPRLSAVFMPAPGHQLRAAFNIGYNNPESVRFFADFEVGEIVGQPVRVVGSPTLDAERMYYGEIGYSGTLHESVRTFINLFAYRMLNYVALNASADNLANFEMPFVNNDSLDAFGGELGVNASINSFVSAYASYAYLHVVGNDDFPYRGDNLGSPAHKLSVGGRVEPLEGFFLTLDGQYFGPSEVDRVAEDPRACAPDCLPFAQTPLGDFIMLHGRAGYAHESGVEISAAVSNILDDRTRQFPGGELPARRFLFTLGFYP